MGRKFVLYLMGFSIGLLISLILYGKSGFRGLFSWSPSERVKNKILHDIKKIICDDSSGMPPGCDTFFIGCISRSCDVDFARSKPREYPATYTIKSDDYVFIVSIWGDTLKIDSIFFLNVSNKKTVMLKLNKFDTGSIPTHIKEEERGQNNRI